MINRENVLKGLECCQKCSGYTCQNCCPYYDRNEPESQPTCTCKLAHDALTLLKVQEPPTSECISSAIECLLHPQDADDSDMAKAIDTAVRAMRLLKAQEPVEPKKVNRYIDFDGEGESFTPETYDCGSCGKELPWKAKYCPECGRAVKAEWTTYNEPLYIIIDAPKEQEPVSVQKKNMEMVGLQTLFWACGNCGQTVLFGAKFCPWCGRALKWK